MYSEFLTANVRLSEVLTNEKLQAVFNLFDIDHNGRITLEEIKSMLGGDVMNQAGISDENWKEILEEVDDNGDGEISFEEFKLMMRNLFDKERRR